MVSSACLISQLTKLLTEPRELSNTTVPVNILCCKWHFTDIWIASFTKMHFWQLCCRLLLSPLTALEMFEQAPAGMFSPKNKAVCQISALGSINDQVGNCRKP